MSKSVFAVCGKQCIVSSKKVLLQPIFIIQFADVPFLQDLGATANFG